MRRSRSSKTRRTAADAFARALPVVPIPADTSLEGASTVLAIERATADVAQGACPRARHQSPITKSKPGFDRLPYPGHTEFLADLAHRYWGVPRPHPVMMLASDLLRVVPVTVHIPVAQVPGALTADLLGADARHHAREPPARFRHQRPRIAVAGLNPHAGEHGLIGREDIDLIAPVLDVARGRGMTVLGPLSADTLFHAEARADYDAALAMYHDQALIPIKKLSSTPASTSRWGCRSCARPRITVPRSRLAGTGKARPDSFSPPCVWLTRSPPAVRPRTRAHERRRRGRWRRRRHLREGSAGASPDGLPPLRDVIAEMGLSARKSLGQNFILDLNLTRRIARAAGPLTGRTVIEIGPGPGA